MNPLEPLDYDPTQTDAASPVSGHPEKDLPLEQDVLWALCLLQDELNQAVSEALGSEKTEAETGSTEAFDATSYPAFPERVMVMLSQNQMACALGEKLPDSVKNMLYWGLNRPLVPVLGTLGAVLMCPVCVYSSGLMVMGMVWWGAKTPRPEQPANTVSKTPLG